MAGPPFTRQKVAIFCCLAYLSTHCTIPGHEKCAGWLLFLLYKQCVWAAGKCVPCNPAKSTPFLTQTTDWPHLNSSRRVMLGSTQGCAQVAGGRSNGNVMSLPASACTPIPLGHPTSTLPSAPPQIMTSQHDYNPLEQL
eukprot:1161329-Pelagomonas_calceolata.AAC.1